MSGRWQDWSPSAKKRFLARLKAATVSEHDEALLGNSYKRYCPHTPFPKQQAFLDLKCQEALFGGAAGPGKTDALLMAAMQYVDVPGYAALILRRDFARLNLPGAIMNRARKWLANSDASWNGSDHRFTFPSGAILQFGYIDNPIDAARYQSAEFQFIGYDELTEFRLSDDENNPYLFMFNRLRSPECIHHQAEFDPTCMMCLEYAVLSQVPLRVRAATNPGNEGHEWCKRRFISEEALAALRDKQPRIFYDESGQRAFVPALMTDNLAINPEKYIKSLNHLPPVARERLKNGDWSIRQDGLISLDWLRYYKVTGEHLTLLDKQLQPLGQFDQRDAVCFITADTAGTSEDKAKEKRGKPSSWSTIAAWLKAPSQIGPYLILLHMWRKRVEFPGLLDGFEQMHAMFPRARIYLENAHFGPAVYALLMGKMQMSLISPEGKDKVTRATKLLNKLEKGDVFLPIQENSWRLELESEWLGWTGLPDETNDQVDVSAYAAILYGGLTPSWGGVSTVKSVRQNQLPTHGTKPSTPAKRFTPW